MELFLTSSVHAVAHDIVKKVDLAKGNRLVFITTPAELETSDTSWQDDDREALVNAGWDVTDYTFTGKVADQIEKDLKVYDFIYMSGGKPAYLLEQSQKTGFIEVIKKLVVDEKKPYIGTSTGSIICGPRLPVSESNHPINLKDTKCYGFVNFTIAPHWGSQYFKDHYLGEEFKRMYTRGQVPLLLLTDNQYAHVQDDKLQIIDVHK